MASIGFDGTTYTMLTVNGQVQNLTERVEEIGRPGINGSAYHRLGKRGEPFILRTVSFHETAADAEDAMLAYDAMTAEVVEVVDNHDTIWSAITVLRVVRQGLAKVVGAVGGGISATSGYMLHCLWEMQVPDADSS